jgi:hypothetical protein
MHLMTMLIANVTVRCTLLFDAVYKCCGALHLVVCAYAVYQFFGALPPFFIDRVLWRRAWVGAGHLNACWVWALRNLGIAGHRSGFKITF